MNGHGSRSSRRNRHFQNDTDRATSQGSDREEEIIARRSLKRKTARAAVNKIKLLEVSDEDYEEEKPRRSSSRLRTSKRTAVIQSSSESDEEPSTHGRQLFIHYLHQGNMFVSHIMHSLLGWFQQNVVGGHKEEHTFWGGCRALVCQHRVEKVRNSVVQKHFRMFISTKKIWIY